MVFDSISLTIHQAESLKRHSLGQRPKESGANLIRRLKVCHCQRISSKIINP